MKKQNGITLIALVITIIVLLILAGVSISSILGDNGLIAKARLAAEKTKQAQLDEHKQLENIDMEMNGGKIKYEVEQKGAYAVIKLYLHVNGSNTYGDYAIEKLYGTTEEEKIQMILSASAFHANKGCWSEPAFESIDELVTYWATNYDMYADCTTLDEIIATGDCENLVDWMISYYYIEPEVLDNESFDDDKSFTLKSGEAVLVEDGSTYMPYVEIPVTASGTYDFELIAGSGTSIKTSVKVNVEGNETAFLYETDENGKIVILGIDSNYTESDGYCMLVSYFEIITIPSKINGVEVTSIADYALSELTNVKVIDMPDTITTIGVEAFAGCTSLEKIEISKNTTFIGQLAFSGCENLKKITIPDGVTSIEYGLFNRCYFLSEINIPDTVQSIGSIAFRRCAITKFDCPASLNSMGTEVFYGCTSLVDVELPDFLTDISSFMFKECSSLKTIDLPDNIVTIGRYAFDGCTSLTTIELPDGLTTIEERAFEACTSLDEIFIPNSVVTIGSYAFRYDYGTNIKCAATSQPSGWDSNWNYNGGTVSWGQTR